MKIVSSQQEFMKIISQQKLVVVDFFAVWCGPCKMVAPMFENLAKKYPNVEFIKVDVDQAPDIAQACGVQAMPTFCFFKDKKPVESNVQGGDMAKVEAHIKKHGNVSAFASGGRTLGSGNAQGSGLAGQAYKNPNAPQDRPKPNDAVPDEYLDVDEATLKRILAQKKLEQAKNQPKPAPAQAADANQQAAPAPAVANQQEQQPASADAAPANQQGEASKVSQEEVMKAIKATVNQEFYNSLMEMGFSEVRTLKSLLNTGSSSLEDAINWLDQHQGDQDIDAPIQFTIETDEEKQQRIAAEKERLKQKLEEKRKAKQEADRKEELEREKKRRLMGKETQESMDKFKEDQRRREAEQAKRAKQKEKEEKERVKRKLEEDKLRRKLEKAKSSGNQAEAAEIERQLQILMGFEPKPAAQTPQAAQQAAPAPAAQQVAPAPAPVAAEAKSDDAILQIRLLDGTTIKATFKPLDTLQTVKNHCSMLQNNQKISLLCSYPRHVYTADELKKTLKDLGLMRGTLICSVHS